MYVHAAPFWYGPDIHWILPIKGKPVFFFLSTLKGFHQKACTFVRKSMRQPAAAQASTAGAAVFSAAAGSASSRT